MLALQVERLKGSSVPVSTGRLLGECMEAKGKQELWTRQRPEVLAALREQAVIQSVESSNRIEGVSGLRAPRHIADHFNCDVFLSAPLRRNLLCH